MNKENLSNELAAAEVTRKRRSFSEEDVKTIVAGVELLKSLGADEKFVKVVEILAPVWHSDDKEALALAKKQIIEEFGGSEEFKNFIEGDFQEALTPFAGLVKLIPICNNIKSFYARRQGTSKPKYKQVQIDGTTYQVNASYLETLAGRDRNEIREMILAHGDTKKVNVEIVEL